MTRATRRGERERRWPGTRAHRSHESLGFAKVRASCSWAHRRGLPTRSCSHLEFSCACKLVDTSTLWCFFVTRRAELARRFPTLMRTLETDGGLWVAWPKRASGVATDLTFEPVQKVGLANGLVDNKVAAIDDIWSGLRFVYRVADRC